MRLVVDSEVLDRARDLGNGEDGRIAAEEIGDHLGELVVSTRSVSTDLVALAAAEGIEVTQSAALREHGRVEWAGGVRRISVNQRDNRPRKRFTVAHELAHCLIFGVGRELRRSYSEEEERRCDRFAASLLMPRDRFECEYGSVEDRHRVDIVRSLAVRFKVSLDSTLFRLHKFQLLPPGSIVVLFQTDDSGEYRVESYACDSSVFRSFKGKTAFEIGIEREIEECIVNKRNKRLVSDLYVGVPIWGKRIPRNFVSRLPAEVTCCSIVTGEGRALADIDLKTEPLAPRLRESAEGRRSDLFEARR